MSLIYPSLPGLTLTQLRSPIWKTKVDEALTGKQSALQLMAYPRIKFEHNYEVLRDYVSSSEIRALAGFFNAMSGRAVSFLYQDPEFSQATSHQFAVADGTTTLFPVTAIYQYSGGPGAPELIQNFIGTPSFFNNGTPISGSAYTLGPSISPLVEAGFILFNTAPLAGHLLTATMQWYYRCRFDEDTYAFSKMQNQLWELKKISFTSFKI